MSTFNLMAVDGHWLLHRALSTASQAPEEARPRVVARQILGWAFTYALQAEASHFFMAFDGPDLYRKKFWPLYKSGRLTALDESGNVMADSERDQLILSGAQLQVERDPVKDAALALSIEYLTAFRVPVVNPVGHESDDHLASACYLGSNDPRVREVLVVTRDKDAIGGLLPRCTLFSPEMSNAPEMRTRYEAAHKRIQEILKIKLSLTWTPEMFRAFQVLVGDQMDDVPPIMPFGKAVRLLEAIWPEFNSLGAWMRLTDEGQEFKNENHAAIARNSKLVIMARDSIPPEQNSVDAFAYEPPTRAPLDIHAPGAVERWNEYLTWKRISSGSTSSLFD